MILSVIVIFLLILLNGLFAMGELALISSRRARLAAMHRHGVPGAERALRLSEDMQSFLPTMQVGITLVSILEGTFGGAHLEGYVTAWLEGLGVFGSFAHEISMTLVVVSITSLMLVFGELVPKHLALRHPEKIAVRVAFLVQVLARVVAPAVWVLGQSSSLVLRLLGVGKTAEPSVTEEELRAYIAEGARVGVLEEEERTMIERLLRLADRPVRAIMSPRNQLAWIERSASHEELVSILCKTEHVRLIVCDGGIDNPVGIIHAKDILNRLLEGRSLSVDQIMRAPVVVPDTAPALDVVAQLRAGGPPGILIVFDEYGAFEGVVTASDVFEAIVGDTRDTELNILSSALDECQEMSLDGFLPVDEIKDRLSISNLPAEGSYHTLAGLVLALLRRVPSLGDKVVFSGWLFEVTGMEGHRILKVKVSRQVVARN